MNQERKSYHKEWCKKNASHLREYKKSWNLKNRARMRASRKRWELKNKSRSDLAKKNWAKNNKEYLYDLIKKWHIRNPHKSREAQAKRRARKFKNGINLNGISELYSFLRKSVFVKCSYCEAMVSGKDLHVDHIVPISRGGRHEVGNLCAACPSCNLSKASKLVSEWRPELANII